MMKKVLIGFFILTGLLAGCRTTDKHTSKEIDASMISPEHPPIMEFDNEVFEFENAPIGTTIKHTFKFKNTGETAVILHDVKASCGCTVLKGWPKEPLAPGEEGEIPVEFTPKATGENLKTVSIVANTVPSTKKLTIKGTVVGTE